MTIIRPSGLVFALPFPSFELMGKWGITLLAQDTQKAVVVDKNKLK